MKARQIKMLRSTLLGRWRHYAKVRVTADRFGPRFANYEVLVGLPWLLENMPDAGALIVSARLSAAYKIGDLVKYQGFVSSKEGAPWTASR